VLRQVVPAWSRAPRTVACPVVTVTCEILSPWAVTVTPLAGLTCRWPLPGVMASWLAAGDADGAWPAAAGADPPLAVGDPLEQAASSRPTAAVTAARTAGDRPRRTARAPR
jgi:hypothetical protein